MLKKQIQQSLKSYLNKGLNMKYLDLVELIKEKPANGKWQVVFSEFYTGIAISGIMVEEEDLKVHDSVPKDRYPKNKTD